MNVEAKNNPSLRDRIEEAIVSGIFKPGDRLEEQSLAEQYGVSRTPVREALRQLQEAGLVEIKPRRGAAVTVVGPADLIHMFEVMGGLEAMAGRLAARRLDEASKRELLACHEACRAAATQGSDAYYYENERFHMAIYRASGNPFLEEQARSLHRRLKPYRRIQLRSLNRIEQSFAEHDKIVTAIVNGHSSEAEQALWDHITIQADRFHDFLAGLSRDR
ncbi:GntR family transcriptional regulator (plasmid) [Rhizobium rosettiformans]|uniref:GntR family transcriptional regulator n=1 Tax=Rhizobium rosettiformans TaxID=1368430 RepID=A0ABX7F1Q5_9HYPH|nr:GntR family transcriptional regulator [Rhizobium rosettiformans]QRF54247.1 GntR family transcriptional regulator [Rhizobium rosettiformans]